MSCCACTRRSCSARPCSSSSAGTPENRAGGPRSVQAPETWRREQEHLNGFVLGAELAFAPAALVSLGASALLITRLERLSARLRLPEALLGLIVALAADAPEVTSAVSALASGQRDVGAGVILGSNAFNLAALLGLAAIVAGRIALHRRVVLLEGAVALWLAAVAIALATGVIASLPALALALAVLLPYGVVSAVHPARRRTLPLPARWTDWLAGAISDEELELTQALSARSGGPLDAVTAAAALIVVVVASVVMEQTAVRIGARYAVPGILTGALVLAAVTSLPNMVSAIYLARRGRASATLSTALNSNTLNVLAGLLLPAVIIGAPAPSPGVLLTAGWYGGLTIAVIAVALARRGLSRGSGIFIVLAYLALVPALLTA
ncbi:MAG: sodium:calcium antiporter [Streptosporangiaceae bacterium]